MNICCKNICLFDDQRFVRAHGKTGVKIMVVPTGFELFMENECHYQCLKLNILSIDTKHDIL